MEFQNKDITSLLTKLEEWLGDEGKEHFQKYYNDYQTVSPVIPGQIPHPVHFREGMQIRNFLRAQKECKGWNDHDLDNNWAILIEAVVLDQHKDPESLTHETPLIRAIAKAWNPCIK